MRKMGYASVNQKKKTLAGGIVAVIVILILAGVLLAAACVLMLDVYHRQMTTLQYQVSEEHFSGISQRLGVLNMDLRDILYNGEETGRVSRTAERVYGSGGPDEAEYGDILRLNSAVADLKQAFLNMERMYGMSCHFFYYDTAHDIMVEYGEGDYLAREAFAGSVKKQYEEGRLTYTADLMWYIRDDCLCTIHRSENGLIGCWIALDDMVTYMFRTAPEQCVGIGLYFPDTGEAVCYEQGENKRVVPGRNVLSGVDYYRMEYAGFSCSFLLDTSAYRNMILYPLCFLILIIFYLIFVSGVLIYMKKNILGQIGYFYDNLLRFKDTARFQENSSVIEFAEAGKVLNELADEINRLKIDIYEEQIARQKTELDYLSLQIRPHFYLNCLNIIYSMVEAGRTKEIQEIILQVSVYLRYIFRRNMEPVTIEKELAFTESYLKVTECLNRESYPCQFHIEEGLQDFPVPPLLIQTFVENSLKHNRDTREGFYVAVRVDEPRGEEKRICRITISDYGKGFPPEFAEQLNAGQLSEDNSGYHVGIRNALMRLKLLYGDGALIRFGTEEGGGGRVTILIPETGGESRCVQDFTGTRGDG